MAPPTPVHTAADIKLRYAELFTDPEKHNCKLMSITQYECTFKVDPQRIDPPEIICLPFKRLFQRCLVASTSLENGRKKRIQKWINIEVTDADTNNVIKDTKYGREVKDFLRADEDLKRILESETA